MNGIVLDENILASIHSENTQQSSNHSVSTAHGDIEPLIEEEYENENTDDSAYHVTETTQYAPGPYNDIRALDGAAGVTLKRRWQQFTGSRRKREGKGPKTDIGVKDLIVSTTMRKYTMYLSLIW